MPPHHILTPRRRENLDEGSGESILLGQKHGKEEKILSSGEGGFQVASERIKRVNYSATKRRESVYNQQ